MKNNKLNKDITYIYALIDPETFEVRYIGKADNPWNRLYVGNTLHVAHLNDEAKTYKVYWIKSLKRKNLVPILQILEICKKEICKKEICKKEIWKEREIDWIAFYKKIGSRLTNLTDGGDGLLNPSLETRKKISESNILRWKDEEFKKYMSEINKGRKHTEQAKQKMSDARKGIESSEETKQKKSEKSLEMWQNTEIRQNLIEKRTGVKHSEASKEKRRQKMLKKHSEKTPEERSEIIKKGHETRRLKKEELNKRKTRKK